MSAHTKKHLIKKVKVTISIPYGENLYLVPMKTAENVARMLKKYEYRDSVPGEEVFKDLIQKYTVPGATLRGARHKENYTQKELAKKLKITQGDLSKMEHGKRPIGKAMAKRLSRALNIGYKVFL